MLYKWETKFKPGDSVRMGKEIGIVDTFAVGTFLNHNLGADPKTTENMKDNGIGNYMVTYEVVIKTETGPKHKYYNEKDLVACDN
jgi:hypothetical protein